MTFIAHGDLLRMTHFMHYEPHALRPLSFKARRGEYAVFLLLGREPCDGSNPLDVVAAMRRLGWAPVTQEVDDEQARQAADPGDA
jgi:hypothetical protein